MILLGVSRKRSAKNYDLLRFSRSGQTSHQRQVAQVHTPYKLYTGGVCCNQSIRLVAMTS